jgi:hypothetical protein
MSQCYDVTKQKTILSKINYLIITEIKKSFKIKLNVLNLIYALFVLTLLIKYNRLNDPEN